MTATNVEILNCGCCALVSVIDGELYEIKVKMTRTEIAALVLHCHSAYQRMDSGVCKRVGDDGGDSSA